MDIKDRNLQRLYDAQASYLDKQSTKLDGEGGQSWGFYLGYGTFKPAQHCVRLPNGNVVCGDINSMQTNGSPKEGQKVMVQNAAGGQPMFYSMPQT